MDSPDDSDRRSESDHLRFQAEVAHGEQPPICFDEDRRSELQTAEAEAGAEGPPSGPGPAHGDPDRFDPSLGQVHLRSGKRVRVRPDRLHAGDGKDVFLPAKMSGIPWPALEALYRSFWIVLSAALGVPREAIKYASGERIQGTYLYSAASYHLTEDDAAKLDDAKVQQRIDVGMALLGDRYLWVPAELPSRYPGLPWQEMLQACQGARDEVASVRLPCSVSAEFKGAHRQLGIEPELAPKRPATIHKETVTETGHSNGYRHRYDHKLFFAKNDGKPPVEIVYEQQTMLERVIAVSGADPPWIEVKYEVERHDGVVVSRYLLSLEVKNDSLFGAEAKS